MEKITPGKLAERITGKRVKSILVEDGYTNTYSLEGIEFEDGSRIMLSGAYEIGSHDVRVKYEE